MTCTHVRLTKAVGSHSPGKVVPVGKGADEMSRWDAYQHYRRGRCEYLELTTSPDEPPEDKAVSSTNKSDPAAREKLAAMAEDTDDVEGDQGDGARDLGQLEYSELWSIACDVRERTGDEIESRSGDALRAYLREHGYE